MTHAQDCIEETYKSGVLYTGHKDTVSTVAFSSDGNLLACGSFDGQINIWNTATRALHGTLEGSGSGFEVRCSVQCETLAFSSRNTSLFDDLTAYFACCFCSGLNGIHEDM
jgi:WD40 repeat protein